MAVRRIELFKEKVKRVAIVHRFGTKDAARLASQVADWLKKRKIEVYSHPEQSLKGAKKVSAAKNLDLVVVLGGDGTYLEAVRMLKGERVPLLGFNLGGLGFLTVNRSKDVYTMLEMALTGKLEIKRRSMIRIELRSKGKVKKSLTALNDLVLERGSLSRLISIHMAVEDQPITSLKADGLIVATPTGSSAYNLAAGGPILHPEVNALVVTPICPHSLTSRPFICPEDRRIQLTTEGQAEVTVDGVKVATLSADDEISVVRDASDHAFLRRPGSNYFDLLKEKLKFGERA